MAKVTQKMSYGCLIHIEISVSLMHSLTFIKVRHQSQNMHDATETKAEFHPDNVSLIHGVTTQHSKYKPVGSQSTPPQT